MTGAGARTASAGSARDAAPPPELPTVIVLPVTADEDAHTVVAVAAQTERAVLAATGGPARVCTVLLDAGPAHDPRRRDAFLAADAHGVRCAFTLPGASWGAAVARGFRHALQLGAGLVVLADAHTLTDDGVPPHDLPVTTAIARVRAQSMPGVVCSPLALPWWQRLLAMHVLRPLAAPGLGLMLADPQPRTLVLAPRAVHVALAPAWRLHSQTWADGHGLGILAAARRAGLSLDETPSRTPMTPPPTTELRGLIDRDTTLDSLITALATAPLAPDKPTAPVPVQPCLGDTAPPGLARQDVLATALAQATRARRDLPLPDVPRAAGWPEPLIHAWHAARGLTPNLVRIAHGLFDAYTDRVHAWLRTAAGIDADTDRLTQSVTNATTTFLAATATPIAPTTAPTPEDHDRPLPHTG